MCAHKRVCMSVGDVNVNAIRQSYVVMLRGGCTFATKGKTDTLLPLSAHPLFITYPSPAPPPARNALEAGAAGVIIGNTHDESFEIEDPSQSKPLDLVVVMIGQQAVHRLIGMIYILILSSGELISSFDLYIDLLHWQRQ